MDDKSQCTSVQVNRIHSRCAMHKQWGECKLPDYCLLLQTIKKTVCITESQKMIRSTSPELTGDNDFIGSCGYCYHRRHNDKTL